MVLTFITTLCERRVNTQGTLVYDTSSACPIRPEFSKVQG